MVQVFTIPINEIVPGMFILRNSQQTNMPWESVHINNGFTQVFQIPELDTRKTMLLHATTGSITLTLVTIQFITPIRQQFPQFHRWIGYIAMSFQMINLSSSAYHLGIHGTNHFSGKEFTVALWIMLLVASVAMIMSLIHVIVPAIRNIRRHRYWSALNFGTINSAPLIRIFWCIFPKLGFHGTQAECNVASALLTYIGVGIGVFLYMTLSEPHRPSFHIKSFVGIRFQFIGCTVTLFSLIGAVGLGQSLFLGFVPHWNLWGDSQPEFELAQTIPLSQRFLLLGGFLGSLLIAPFYTYQSVTNPRKNRTTLRTALYSCFVLCCYGLYGYVPIVSTVLYNTWPIFWSCFVFFQWFFLFMEWYFSGGGGCAQQIWILLQWANLCVPAFVYATWPIFPYLWNFTKIEAYNSAIQICIVPWIVVFVASLYLPISPHGK